ncbi:MAG TPA: rod shape-determining protein MreC [Albitalea sp.]|uniref:rod shape-determining protein MreC n=1 Tax=Piscinibacter sp. TaxID=1903157 RepID=UPI002ED3FA50
MATPLGTLDRTPPPFFRQGPSALTKLTFCSALAIFLMVADTRLKLTHPVRTMIATVLHPVERVLRVPIDAWNAVGDYAMGLQNAMSNEAAARAALARQAERAARVEALAQENNRLRALLGLRSALTVRSQPAEVLYEASDPYSRKVVIDRGTTQGVALASPVINEAGVLGQVTRVYPLSSEVTLLTDKDAAIPVLNVRNQLRSAAFGTAGTGMELRFMAGNADVQVGDQLQTSGVDGIYPSGLAVAKVTAVDRKVDTGFARVALVPMASPDGVRHVLVLEPLNVQLPPRPEPQPDDKPAKAAKKGARK